MSEALVSLYQNKLRLFKNLEILSRQFAAISITPQSENDGGLSRLQALLDERANLMDEIDALDEQIARHADGEQSEPEEVQEIKKELLALVEQIQKMSARLEKELDARLVCCEKLLTRNRQLSALRGHTSQRLIQVKEYFSINAAEISQGKAPGFLV